MYTTNLRKVGGSVMLAVPPAFLEQLHLEPGAEVGLAVEGERLVVETKKRPKYTLDELLSKSDYSAPMDEETREWLDAPPVGRELL
ncbi:MAG: antitoxin [Acidobacteria bacterium]|nr:antitoxin [Acidobacteriota bacterium]